MPPAKPKKAASKRPSKRPSTRLRARRKKSVPSQESPEPGGGGEAKESRKETPSRQEGRVHVYSLEGDVVKTVDLPTVFRGYIRTDLIRRAVTAAQANRRQAYGSKRRAGLRHSPGTVGGRRAHPPRPEKVWSKKVNENERRLARNAAIAALKEVSIVLARGHRFKDELSLPVVIEDGIETLAPESGATQEGVKILETLGVFPDVDRAKDGRHVRAGRGKMRGRRYRQPTSLLVVVKDPANVRRLFGNLPGVDVVSPSALNAEILAPGGDPGRLTMFSEGALEVLRGWQA
jgi:large subunit ribosomal protein L4e